MRLVSPMLSEPLRAPANGLTATNFQAAAPVAKLARGGRRRLCVERAVGGYVVVLGAMAALALPVQAAEGSTCAGLAAQFEARRAELAAPQVSAALFASADNGCEQLALRLFETGASVLARDRTGGTALTHAARSGQATLVRLLAAHGAEINQRNVHGASPLYVAVERNRTAAAQALIELGADVNLPGNSNVPPVSAAAYNGNLELVDLLMARHADASVTDLTGKSPVLYAAAAGHGAVVAKLLQTGIDVNARYGHRLNVLMWAAGHANDVLPGDGVRLVSMLLDQGAAVDAVDDRGRTALMIAAGAGHDDIVQRLLAGGADPGRRDGEGKTAADLAETDALRGALAGQ